MSAPTQRGGRAGASVAWTGEVDYRALANSLPALIFVCDATGACVFTNTHVQEFTGLPAEGWLGEGWVSAIHPEDRARAVQAWTEAVATAEPYEVEYRLRAADGHHVWFLARATPLREEGEVVRWVGHATDINDAKRAEAARDAALQADVAQSRLGQREAEEFAARLVEATADSVETLSLDGRILSSNAAGLAALEAGTVGEVAGRPWVETWRPTGYRLAAQQAVEAAAAGATGRFVGRRRTSAGRVQWWNVAVTPVRDADGRIERLLCVSRDVTEVKEAAERVRLIAETLNEVFYQVDIATGRVAYVSPAYETVWGRSAEALATAPTAWMDAIHPEDRAQVLDALARQRRGESTRREYRIQRPDGTLRHVRDLAYPLFDEQGRPTQVLGSVEDVTEAREAQARAAAADEARYRGVFETATVGIARVALDGRFLEVNGRLCEMLGYRREELLAGGFQEITHPEDLDADLANVAALLDGRADAYSMEKRYIMRSGRVLRANLTGGIVRSPEGTADHFVAVVQELRARDRTRAEEAEGRLFRRGEARFRAIIDAMPQIVWSAQADGSHDFYNARWYEFTGVEPGSTDGAGWNAIFHPEDQPMAWARWRRSLGTGEPYEIEYRLRHRDGTYRWVLGRALPVRDEGGEIVRWMGTCTDIHEIVETRQALAESRMAVEAAKDQLEARVAERTAALEEVARTLRDEMARREETQNQLLQAQKMEALGQLVGGVAHDFNNILAAIQGAFAVLDRRVEAPKLRPVIEQGRKAGDRAATLVRQMLAFARREDLAPQVVRPGELVGSLETMIGHTAGARVACDFDVAPDAWPVLVDPHQLEVTLLNLAINARDAMRGEGTLRVGLRNLGPQEARPAGLGRGDHVVLSVADSGVGMDEGTVARVFEPFFTTKPRGQGTGLGLAQVQGFVQRAGGAIQVESRPGRGTTMSLYLPRSTLSVAGEAAAPVISPRLHGHATVLVVDDDDQVRPVIAAYLRDLGYTVVEAASMGAALALVQVHAIDLLLSDLVMPGSDGLALAQQLRAVRPRLPVLFMSGHPDDHRLGAETVLAKPFTGPALELELLRGLGRIDRRAAERLASPRRRPDRLLARLTTPALREPYDRWSAILGGRHLPDLADFDMAGLEAGRTILLRPEPGEGGLAFRVQAMGPELAARLGGSLEGQLVTEGSEDALGSMREAYRRCLTTLAPTYDWARLRLPDGTVRLDRLILPFSGDGAHISHLLGFILYEDVPG